MRDTRAYPTPLRIAPCVCREAHSMQRSDASAPRVTPPLAGRPSLRWSAASLLTPPPARTACQSSTTAPIGRQLEGGGFCRDGHFRVMRPVLPVGSCRLRPERGPEAGATGRSALRRAERAVLQQDSESVDGVATPHNKLAANYPVFSSSHQYGRGCALVSLHATP
jgi:hypothetical protein